MASKCPKCGEWQDDDIEVNPEWECLDCGYNTKRCWICGDVDCDIVITVECEEPNGKACPPTEVNVHSVCYAEIEP